MVKPLDEKLRRDLWNLKGQVLTIALVVACGITSFVTYRSVWVSLTESRDAYYDRYRFGDVFAHLKRAPLSVKGRLEAIPEVERVHARIVRSARLFVDDLEEPATAQLISVPIHGEIPLNGVQLTAGRMLDPRRDDEVVVGEPFAEEHDLAPGHRLEVVSNGSWQHLTIVGLAHSPEFVFSVAPQSIISDDRRFTPLWMSRNALGPAFDMDGAFNDIVVDLERGAPLAPVLDRIDRELEAYGGLGAFGRDRHPSDSMLTGELQQVEAMVLFVPVVFLGVAAFLLNVVLSRLVLLQRPQIATLKAVGYSNWSVGFHYLQMVTLIVVLGSVVGIGFGAWASERLAEVYTAFYRLPLLVNRLDAGVATDAVLVSLASAVGGGWVAVRQAIRLPPAEAMRPPPPATYRRSLFDRVGLQRVLGPSARMVLREIERRPLRTLVSSVGVSFAVAILVLGRFGRDAFPPIIDLQFGATQKEDVTVDFAEPIPDSSLAFIDHIPGVLRAEGLRYTPVRLVHGHRWRDTAIVGIPAGSDLRRPHERDFTRVPVPEHGIMLSRVLGEILDVEPGDEIEIRVREGDRETRVATVTKLIDDAFGISGYMRKRTLHHLLGEAPRFSTALLRVEPGASARVMMRLRDIPNAERVVRKATILEQFRSQSQRTMLVVTMIMTLFAGSVAVGVVYNNARVALSMRSRDLASLRVLGFTRGEVSAILFGEQAFQVLLSLPLGMVLGTWAAHAIVELQADPEKWRLPIIISSRTYAFAITVVVATAVLSAMLVRRRLDRVDLVEVLKTRE